MLLVGLKNDESNKIHTSILPKKRTSCFVNTVELLPLFKSLKKKEEEKLNVSFQILNTDEAF